MVLINSSSRSAFPAAERQLCTGLRPGSIQAAGWWAFSQLSGGGVKTNTVSISNERTGDIRQEAG